MDARELNVECGFSNVNARRMTADFTEYGEVMFSDVPMKFDVCPLCDGKGTHVNPSIDSHGISPEEFREDPEFAEDYFGGIYDVPCNECGGLRVVPVLDREHTKPEVAADIDAAFQAHREFAAQCAYERRMGY